MICDFCRHEIADVDVIEARDIRRIPAWCNHCGAFSNGKDGMRLPHLGICLAMDRTYEEARVKMEGPHICNRPKGHEGKHECVVGDRLLARWSHDAAIKNELLSVEELIVRVFPELSLVTASVVERFLKSREKTCSCASIMADDPTRHFRGCPLREKYPDHPAAKVDSHIVDGEFQSDKYPTCPPGKVPLSTKDPMAQDLLWEYARRRESVDAEFSSDLREALRAKGFLDETLRHTAFIPTDETTTEEAYRIAKAFHDEMTKRNAGPDAFTYHLALLLKSQIEAADTYRETCKAAQERGTEKHNQIVHVRNLLRVAQPYLEAHNLEPYNEDGLELAVLCEVIAKEIGTLEDNTTEEDGRMVAERLGIDIEKWAAELRAKVDAAVTKDTATKEGDDDGNEK